MNDYLTPAIAVPSQTPPLIWWNRPAADPTSDGHDLHAILESREEAERYVAEKNHNYLAVKSLIKKAFPDLKKTFATRTDLQSYVESQPIEFGEHGNPTVSDIIDMIQCDSEFAFGEDASDVIDRVFAEILGE